LLVHENSRRKEVWFVRCGIGPRAGIVSHGRARTAALVRACRRAIRDGPLLPPSYMSRSDALPELPPPSSTEGTGAMHFIWSIIIGFVVGLVARALMPGPNPMGFILTTILGVIGSVAATYLGQAMGWYSANGSAGFIASVLGAMVLLFIYGVIARPRR
jgi:uncharacterized membrane protein YeaQ/YmgE (transglycosylase-associated protein family)